MTDSQFNQLLDIVFAALDNELQVSSVIDELIQDDIVPSVIYELIQDDELQTFWDALNHIEQKEICDDLRDYVMNAVRENQEYLKSDEYMELQYINSSFS